MAKICKHCFVSGLVQGVFFRANTQKMAETLGLTGWAKNLADGRVEVLACGEEASVHKLLAWLKVGPAKAKVASVEIFGAEYSEYKELVKFEIAH